jgi:hypothetical protein
MPQFTNHIAAHPIWLAQKTILIEVFCAIKQAVTSPHTIRPSDHQLLGRERTFGTATLHAWRLGDVALSSDILLNTGTSLYPRQHPCVRLGY